MEEIKTAILIKMARKDYWGSRMINFSDLIKSVPRHLRGKAKIAVDEIFKEGLLNRKVGMKSEFRYSLRLEYKEEIDRIIMSKNNTFKV